MDEPTGYTIDGTPWDDPRPPHLPDPVVGVARRVPVAAWAFVVLAVLLALWSFRDVGGLLTQIIPTSLLSLFTSAVQPVATCLFGAALFLRHPSARRTDPRIVFGIVLLVAVEVMQVAGSQFSEFLQGIVPPEVETNPFFAPGVVLYSLLWRTIAVFGLLYLARGLVDAREQDEDGGARRRGWLIAAVAMASILVAYGTFFVPWSRGQLDFTGGWAVVDYLGLLVLAAATIGSTAYLTLVASTGRASGERPPGAWRAAATGLWMILLAGLATSSAYLVGYLVNIGQADAETLFWVVRLTAIVSAAGYLLVLLGFWRGLPGVDEVGPDVDEVGPDETETDEAEAAGEAAGTADPGAESWHAWYPRSRGRGRRSDGTVMPGPARIGIRRAIEGSQRSRQRLEPAGRVT